jgi:release factor glutamine methyltransferase
VVNQNVLVPRAETEAIVEFVIKNAPKDSLMHDVGTGSGAIAISVKSNRLDMKVSGSDISSDALKIARLNSKNMKIDVDFMVSDLLESVDGKFDVITANLPYIPRGRKLANEVLVEPTIAIFGGIDGLKLYKKLFSQIPTHINPKAQLIIEHEPQQMHQIKLLSRRSDAKKMQEISNYVSVIRF